MSTRRILSYALFLIAVLVIVLAVVGVFGDNLLVGIVVGLAAALVGFIFYRRG